MQNPPLLFVTSPSSDGDMLTSGRLCSPPVHGYTTILDATSPFASWQKFILYTIESLRVSGIAVLDGPNITVSRENSHETLPHAAWSLGALTGVTDMVLAS